MTSGLRAVRSGMYTALHLVGAYFLLLWLTFELTMQFFFCCPVVALVKLVALSDGTCLTRRPERHRTLPAQVGCVTEQQKGVALLDQCNFVL